MTVDEMAELFEQHENEQLRWERVAVKLSDRRDLHGMMLLHRLDPQTGDILAAAEHDQVWYAADPEVVARNITEEQIKELLRCGIYCDPDDNFYSFV